MSITGRIQKPKRSPGGHRGQEQGRKACVVGNPPCSICCPLPHSKAWPSSAAEQCAARSSGTPVHPPRSPLETSALLGKAPVAKASSGIDTPCPACGETTQFTAIAGTQRLLTPLLNINSGAVQLCKTPCSPATTTKARSQGLEVPKGSGLIRSWLPHSLPPPTGLTHSLTLPLPLPESWP